MAPDFLSEVELYYTDQPVSGHKIIIDGDECHHMTDVMRHKVGDIVHVTDGKGSIYRAEILNADKQIIVASVKDSVTYDNLFKNIVFCLPRLKSADRFEFALEKCVELGITSFIVFESKRSVARGEKIVRWEKILVAAMKQSLRSWLPKITYVKNLQEIFKRDGLKILFEQSAGTTLKKSLQIINSQSANLDCFFIFGPEGGLSGDELSPVSKWSDSESVLRLRLTKNRLRSETAVVIAASLLGVDLSD